MLYHDHDKYITTQEFHKITKQNFAVILKEAKVVIKGDIADVVERTYFDKKLKRFY